MRILAVFDGEFGGTSDIIRCLTGLGHDVRRFIYGPAAGEFYGRSRAGERKRKNRELLDTATSLFGTGGRGLIFVYVYDDFLLPETGEALSRLGVPIVNLNVDMANQWYRQIKTARFFTYVLCAQRAHMDALAAYGARVLFFPMAANANDSLGEAFHPAALVTFLGSPTVYRSHVLSEIERAGIPLAVYGRGWGSGTTLAPQYGFEKTASDIRNYAVARIRHEGLGPMTASLRSHMRWSVKQGDHQATPSPCHCHGAVPASQLGSLFRSSAINIGFTRMSDIWDRNGNNQVKLRDFEVPLSGGFYLVEEAPDHAELYDVGREIVVWRSLDDLIEKCRWYLAHPAERESVAAQGMRRAVAEHTWEHRFRGLFERLGLS